MKKKAAEELEAIKVPTGRIQRTMGCSLISIFLIFIYLTLVCSKAGVGYLGRPGVIFGIAFYLILTIIGLASFGLKICPKSTMIAPVILLLALTMTGKEFGSFRENTVGGIPGPAAAAVSRDMISQIQKADREHQTSMVLHVPKGDNRDNWPQPGYMGHHIARTLFYHGMITRELKIEIQPDTSMNQKYGIPIPEN